jgi:DNA (cytosine-5)-methyltransferase 1
MSNQPKIFSFFSGSGFLDLGFEDSGFNVVYVSEIFSPFVEAYRYSRLALNKRSPEYGYQFGEDGDVMTLLDREENISKLLDLIKDAKRNSSIIGFIGGPPCPDFSIGGKNRGQNGNNGKLSASYIELICRCQPDFFVFENVKGLWKTKKHRLFFEDLKLLLNQAGYVLTERLINAIEYGVPQDRDRIILIGFTKYFLDNIGIKNGINNYGIDENKMLLPESIFPWEKYILYPKKKIFSLPWSQREEFKENGILPIPKSIPLEITVEYWFQKNNVLNHPNGKHYFKPKAGLIKFATIAEGDDSGKSYKRLHRWRYSPTACYGNNEVHLHPYKVRRISVSEALAIQSLPSEFVLPDNMSMTNMFKTIGNGVPYLAAKGIAQTIKDFCIQGNLIYR